MVGFQKKLLVILIICALAAPAGIFLPKAFDAEDAWGEWSTETVKKMIGYIPHGMEKIGEIWKAPIPDYNFGDDTSPLSVQVVSYIASAFIGIILCLGVFYLIKIIVYRSEK